MSSFKLNPNNVFSNLQKNNITKCFIGLYVDDMVIAGENEYIKQIINKIKSKYKISKCDPIEYILGIEVKKRK